MHRIALLLCGAIASSVGWCGHPALAQPPAPLADRLARWAPLIAEAAARFSLPEAWIRAVIAAESGGLAEREGAPLVSRAGAIGLMQLMPATYAEMRQAHALGPDPQAPRDNILAGTAYLRLLHDRFGWPGLFAAYNAGPARYEAHLRTGQALPNETQAYLATLFSRNSSLNSEAKPRSQTASGRSIFFVRRSPESVQPPSMAAASLFVPLRRSRRIVISGERR